LRAAKRRSGSSRSSGIGFARRLASKGVRQLEPEYWDWLREIAAKTGVRVTQIIEGITALKNPRRSLASEIRVAVAAYFHGNPYPIRCCSRRIVVARSGGLHFVDWPAGRPHKAVKAVA
jgi:predicted DNA-binding ribbon-helix-helix protein